MQTGAKARRKDPSSHLSDDIGELSLGCPSRSATSEPGSGLCSAIASASKLLTYVLAVSLASSAGCCCCWLQLGSIVDELSRSKGPPPAASEGFLAGSPRIGWRVIGSTGRCRLAWGSVESGFVQKQGSRVRFRKLSECFFFLASIGNLREMFSHGGI